MPKAQNKFDLPGVYKLNCSNCNKFYIGQTGRSFKNRYIEHTKALHSTTESTFVNHHIEANHTYKNIDNNMNTLHVHTEGRKLDTLEQLEIYKHMKTNKNNILNEQTQFKSHALFEHISPHTHNIDLSKAVSYTHLDVYKRQVCVCVCVCGEGTSACYTCHINVLYNFCKHFDSDVS